MPEGTAVRTRKLSGGAAAQRRRAGAARSHFPPREFEGGAGPTTPAAPPERPDMNTWQAPKLAYELAAEWARGVAACRGGGCGHTPDDFLGKQWGDLTSAGKRDVLDALAAQARGALWDLGERGGGIADLEAMTQFLEQNGAGLCTQSIRNLTVLLHPFDSGDPWEVPACPHCAALTAALLIGIHVGAVRISGIADPAALLGCLAAAAAGRREGQ